MFDIRELLGQGIGPIKIVDVGAMVLKNSYPVYQPLIDAKLATLIGFEPVEEECVKAQAFLGAAHRCLPYAIGDGTRRKFHICSHPMNSSLYEPNFPLLELFQNLAEIMTVERVEEVQTHRLDDLPEVKDTDYLKIDVQGAELDVINGATNVLANAVVVQVEVEFVAMYKDQPLFAEVDQAMRKHGFVLHRMLGILGRVFKPLSHAGDINRRGSQDMWSDVAYVKDFMRLQELSPQQLLKLAAILHTALNAIDLVTVVLKAYDEKMQTSHAPEYVKRVISATAKP